MTRRDPHNRMIHKIRVLCHSMTAANHLVLALEELQREYAGVIKESDQKKRELSALETRSGYLGDAIASLKRVILPEDASLQEDVASESGGREETNDDSAIDDALPEGSLVRPDSPIAKYIKRGGEGRRLSSTTMIVDVVEELDVAVTRDGLKDAFFEKFSRVEMARFWERVDNAFGTALARSVDNKLIVRGHLEDGTEVYGSLALAERLQAEEEAASPGAHKEE